MTDQNQDGTVRDGVVQPPAERLRKDRRLGSIYDADIVELMEKDHTISEMVEAIHARYSVKVSATYVSSRARKQNHAYPGWKKREAERIRDRVTRRNYRTGRSADPRSRKSRLRTMGIPERSFYSVREELRDMGVEHTEQDIIDICMKRRRA